MTLWLMDHEFELRIFELLALLVGLSIAQLLIPRRGHSWIARRWLSNLGLIAISNILLRLVVPIGATAFALWLGRAGFGLFNQLEIGGALEVGLTLICLDLAMYWQHRAFHTFPLLWRAHRVHHSDVAFDVSLGLRFHPFEILPSMAYKLAAIALLGASPVAVLIYESLLLGFSLITHADVALSARLDRLCRLLFVTPDWHRVHHSVHRDETNSNYGNILSVWDRLFGTYVPQPRDGHLAMVIGLSEFRDAKSQSLPQLLRQPFNSEPAMTMPLQDDSHA